MEGLLLGSVWLRISGWLWEMMRSSSWMCSEPPRKAGETTDTQALALEILFQLAGEGSPGICIFIPVYLFPEILMQVFLRPLWKTWSVEERLCACCFLSPAHSWSCFRAQLNYISEKPSLSKSLFHRTGHTYNDPVHTTLIFFLAQSLRSTQEMSDV